MGNLETFDIKSHVVESIVAVFDTMVSMEIVPSDAEPEDAKGVDRVVAGVNFAGNVAGILNIQVPSDLARLMTANRLDMEPEALDGDGEMKDLFSEICNIVGGNLKSALNDAGLPCDLATPAITSGGDFTIRSLNMERFERFVFMYQQDWIIAEVGIKTGQGAEDGEGLAITDAMGRLKDVDIDKVNAIDSNAKVAEANAEQSPEPSPDHAASPQPDPTPPPPAEPQASAPPTEPGSKTHEDVDLNLLLDIPLEIKVELGRARIQIHELLNLVAGSAVKLTKLEGEPVDILANEILIAKGEVVVQREKYGIRVTEITSRLDRIRSFGL